MHGGEWATPRAGAVGGIIGPAAFVTAWAFLGARAADYSPVHDAISLLAAPDAPSRVAMTTGFIVFGIGVPLYAVTALRPTLPGPAWALATATGLATLGVAAVPIGSPTRDVLHGAFAGVGYVTLAGTPAIASRAMARLGRRGWSRYSVVTGVVSATCLAATVLGRSNGLLQRLGLAAGDLWIVLNAADILLRRSALVPRGDNAID